MPSPANKQAAPGTKDCSDARHGSAGTNATTTREKPSTPPPTLETELRSLVHEYELDQNFPQDVLKRAREYLAAKARNDSDEEAAQSILDEFLTQKDLILNNSPYSEVRAVVDPTDDPTLPVGTFRVFLLGTLFTLAGTALHQFFSLRMPSIAITTYIVQLLALPMGTVMTKWLPERTFGKGWWQFSLNPGPFSQKEHLLIAMMANVSFGGTSSGAYIVTIIQVLKLDVFFGETVLANSIPWQVTTLLATQLMGYGCAGMTRRFLVYPPAMIWQRPLATIALTKALYKDNGQSAQESAHGWTISRYRFFFVCFAAMFAWYWVPNYLFEGIALFNWPTWISPGNVTLAIIAGSSCGLGLNPFPTLDWNIATYLVDPIVSPLFTLLNFAAGMAISGFFIAPAMYFSNVWNAGYLPINSNRAYDNTGAPYNVRRILNPDLTFNETAYNEYSIPWISTTQTIHYAAYLTVYVAVVVHIVLFFGKDIKTGVVSAWKRIKRADQFPDVHNRLMAVYPECPQWWYLIVLVISFLLACCSVLLWPTVTPVWAICLALIFNLALQVPVGMLAAITNIEVPLSILAQVIGGYALEGKVIPNMVFRMFAYITTSQSLNFISDLKMAHYAKIPPRWAFAAQIYATVLSGFVALGVNHWVLRNVADLCTNVQKDRFFCPWTHSYFQSSILWGVIGPRRLFGPGAHYNPITYAIPVGIVLPIIAYFAIKRWPTSLWRSVNIPIFLAGPLGWAPYNWSYMQGPVVLGLLFNYFIKRRYKVWWERYAYVMACAFGTAIGVSGLVMFFGLQMPDIRLDWWGNQVGRAGVDKGGFLGVDGKPLQCVNLPIPPEGHFASGL
ncbi:hypothetical protein S7711_05176 [Stachybotrys chartarum IBT 7711]|uniref:OPT family small oligopeptide transporter n=1 Tax=Stachybotrys chartarum (strain CBS 109288 / IBT 7711) TaxID=1280523 RepID=A0A084B4M4_STACB|nr:hypothetical protein S7711_05176 [Stachybotrys chartarum IBT 7711]